MAGWLGPAPLDLRISRVLPHDSAKPGSWGPGIAPGRSCRRCKGLEVLPTFSPIIPAAALEGTFGLQHPGLSRQIGEAYLAAVSATGASGLVSLDYSCLLHLQGLGRAAGRDLKFYHLAEILTMTAESGLSVGRALARRWCAKTHPTQNFSKTKRNRRLNLLTDNLLLTDHPSSGGNSSWWGFPAPGWMRRPGNWCGT